jgi:hypothetical protein
MMGAHQLILTLARRRRDKVDYRGHKARFPEELEKLGEFECLPDLTSYHVFFCHVFESVTRLNLSSWIVQDLIYTR